MSDFFRIRIMAWTLFWVVLAIIFMIVGVTSDSDEFMVGFLLIIFMISSHAVWVFGDQEKFYDKPKRNENDEYFEAMREDK